MNKVIERALERQFAELRADLSAWEADQIRHAISFENPHINYSVKMSAPLPTLDNEDE